MQITNDELVRALRQEAQRYPGDYDGIIAGAPANYMSLLVRRATMEGFLYFDNAADFPVARRRLAGWMKSGCAAR